MLSPEEFDSKFSNQPEVEALLERVLAAEDNGEGLAALVLASCVETQWLVGGSVNGPSLRDPWWRDIVVENLEVIQRLEALVEAWDDDPEKAVQVRGLAKACTAAELPFIGISHANEMPSSSLEAMVTRALPGDMEFAEDCLSILEDRDEKSLRATTPGWVVRPLLVDGEVCSMDMEWAGVGKGRLTMAAAWAKVQAFGK